MIFTKQSYLEAPFVGFVNNSALFSSNMSFFNKLYLFILKVKLKKEIFYSLLESPVVHNGPGWTKWSQDMGT